jgi:hypothetical protein
MSSHIVHNLVEQSIKAGIRLKTFLRMLRAKNSSTALQGVLKLFSYGLKNQGLFPRKGRSWSSSCSRRSVNQFVLVLGLPLGPMTRCYLSLLFSFDNYFVVVPRAPSLMRGRVCSLQCNCWLVRSLTTNNHTLPSHLRLGSLSVASYDSQGLWWKYSNTPPHGVEGRDFPLCHKDQTSRPNRYSWPFSQGWNGCGMKLSPHLHLVLRLRTCGSINPVTYVSSWHSA